MMDSNECRRAVAAKWSNVEYRSLGTERHDSSASSTDIEEDVRPIKRLKQEVIDLTSDDEDQEKSFSSPFKLIKSEVYDSNVKSAHFITFKEIFGDKRLKKSILFSFQYELDFLLEQFYSGVREIVIVAQKGTIRPCTTQKGISMVDRLSVIEFFMPQYTCHHSKMILNLYDDGSCKMFLPSNNFTYAEANYPQQVCWCSPNLPPSQSGYTEGASEFHDGLIEYLKVYHNEEIVQKIVKEVKLLDFTPLKDVTFIFSAPTKDLTTGFQLLSQRLSDHRKPSESKNSTSHYLCQTSTLGAAISKKTHANLFTHVFIPILHGITSLKSKLVDTETLVGHYRAHNITPYIVYPTVEEIRTSPVGWLCSGWFHFNYNRDMAHYNMLAEELSVFYKQDPKFLSVNRKATPSHSKFYMKSTISDDSNPFNNLDWCLYTSANLSLTAWGSGTARPRNYEAGVLYKSGRKPLVCKSFTNVVYKTGRQEIVSDNSQIVLVPFTLPVVKYDTEQDEAFCMAKDYDLLDIHGIQYKHH